MRLRTVLAVLTMALPMLSPNASYAEPDLSQPVEDCVVRLARSGVSVERADQPVKQPDQACAVADPVRLLSVADPALPSRRIQFPERPVLACAMAESFARFTGDIAAPLALGVFGKELATVATGPGFECRPRNRQAGARLSSHALGLAVDVMGVGLHGGARVSVEKPDGPEAARFLQGIRAAACGTFTTALGPGADAAHANHIHIDMEPRGRDGRSKFCQ
jgi:hypothetical protein